ncbi:hypothetical protein [Streptomyces avermitilis]|uniref:hypothetical protein n=1 Tax=Streptomyces avermitilis TaxID=33903 RepID=UPI00381C9F0E
MRPGPKGGANVQAGAQLSGRTGSVGQGTWWNHPLAARLTPTDPADSLAQTAAFVTGRATLAGPAAA